MQEPQNKQQAIDLIVGLSEQFDIKSTEVSSLIIDDKDISAKNIFTSYIGMGCLFFAIVFFLFANDFGSAEPYIGILISVPLYYLGTVMIGQRSKSILAVPLIAVGVFLQSKSLYEIVDIFIDDLNYKYFILALLAFLTAVQQQYFARLKGSSYIMSIALFYFYVGVYMLFALVISDIDFALPLFISGLSMFSLARYFKHSQFFILTGLLDFFGSILFFIGCYNLVDLFDVSSLSFNPISVIIIEGTVVYIIYLI